MASHLAYGLILAVILMFAQIGELAFAVEVLLTKFGNFYVK